ncbi:unnamed protein product [Haemonchus placei]|uniref:PPP1R35_C domain-containing protein n=1 Tax=Haemonchus placei TaxID=6290 RepID=A0A0N4WXN3_HAEPC|nr:unnamed protein product [Haemonchus placei]
MKRQSCPCRCPGDIYLDVLAHRWDSKEDKTRKDAARITEVTKALGKEPNPAMANKLGKMNEVKNETADKKPSNRDSMLDDTIYEVYSLRHGNLAKKPSTEAIKQTQTLSDETVQPPVGKCYKAGKFFTEEENDDFGPPNAQNFMANITDIDYVSHDMIRTINLSKDLPLPVARENHPPDYHLTTNLDSLEKQQHYGWQSLKANTFLSNVLCLPTDQEKNDIHTAKEKLAKVTFLPKQTMMAFYEKTKNSSE